MKTLLVLAGASLLALSAPALAQNAGAPGATGVGGSMTGSNTGSGSYNGPAPDYAYPDGPGYGQRAYPTEGRAAAPDRAPYDNGYNRE